MVFGKELGAPGKRAFERLRIDVELRHQRWRV
jgi:hypothetical protein